MTKPTYRIEKFDKASHERGAFSCGIAGMDRWFKESISDQIQTNRVRVWCAVDENSKVVGFYALSAHSVEPSVSPKLAQRRERHPIPAIYLVALATDQSVQGKGLGSALMADAMMKSFEISEVIGAAAIVLDVFDDDYFQQRMAFYRKLGFTSVHPDGDTKRLFLPMKEIAKALSGIT